MMKLKLVFWLMSALALPTYASGDVQVSVNGLVCDFCAQALDKTFRKQAAIKDIDVDLEEKVVSLYYQDDQSLDEATIRQLITDSGYNVEAITYTE